MKKKEREREKITNPLDDFEGTSLCVCTKIISLVLKFMYKMNAHSMPWHINHKCLTEETSRTCVLIILQNVVILL